MFVRLSPLRSAAGFYALALGMVTFVALTGASTAVAMYTPTIAALIMLLVVTREGWTRRGWATLGLHRAGLRSWPLALGIPLVIVAISAVAVVATDAARWHQSGQLADFEPWLWPVILLVHIAFASLTVSLTEEIGWRGYLLPRLTELGPRRALLLSGLLHGAWHLPVILLTSLYHPEGSRLVVVPMFLVLVTAVGVFLGWLRLRSDSVWPSVLAHSANNIGVMWLGLLVVGDAVTIAYVAGEGLVATVAYLVLAGVLLVRSGRASDTHTKTPLSHKRLERALP